MRPWHWFAGMFLVSLFVVAQSVSAATVFSIESFTMDCGTLLYGGSTYAFDSNAVSIFTLALCWVLFLLSAWPWRTIRTSIREAIPRHITSVVFGLSLLNLAFSVFILPNGRSLVYVVGQLLAWVTAALPAAACLGPGVPNGYWAINAVVVSMYVLTAVALIIFHWMLRRHALRAEGGQQATRWSAFILLACVSVLTTLSLAMIILNRMIESQQYNRLFFS